MRRLLILIALVLVPAAALAGGRHPQEYKPQDPAVLEALRQANGKSTKLETFTEDPVNQEPERKVPWMFIGFAALLVAGALPFALRAYRSTSTELREAEANRAPQPRPRRRRPTGPTG